MKKYRMVIWGMLVFLGMTSCDKYLDVTPKNVISMDDMESIKQSLASFLRNIRDDGWSSLPSSPFQGNTYGIVAYTEEWDLSQLAENDFTDDEKRICDWRNESNQSLWGKYYSPIGFLNLIIHEAKTAEGDKTMRDYVMGEAYAMRAYCFFKLLQYFAPYKDNELGIPVCLETYEDFESVTLERSTQKEVYRQILSDLKEAEMRLQSTPTRESYNLMYCEEVINRLYAQVYHFKAMSAAAEEEDWKNAIVYAERETNGKELESNPEELKALFNVGEGYSLKSQESPLRVKYGGSMGFGTLFSNKKPNETFRQAYFPEENGDIREKLYYQIVEYFDWGSFQTVKDLKINKYSSYDGWGGDYYYLFCAFRLAETFLIQAEAYVRTEQLEKAQTILRRFKEARYTEAFQIPNTKEALLDEILWERQKEFVAEGDVRWLDMKRLGVKTERTIGGETFKLNGYEDYRYAFPIPLSEINNNKYIEDYENEIFYLSFIDVLGIVCLYSR